MKDMCYKYADYIIEKCKYELNNKRLQKILFLSYVYYLKDTGKKLFEDGFEAWEYGPVVASVYEKYEVFQLGFMYPLLPPQQIDPMKKMAIDKALKDAEKIDTDKLIDNTHKGEPWKNIYNSWFEKNKDRDINSIYVQHDTIPFNLINKYYIIDNHVNELID